MTKIPQIHQYIFQTQMKKVLKIYLYLKFYPPLKGQISQNNSGANLVFAVIVEITN